MSRGTLDPALARRASLTGLSPSLAGLPSSVLLRSSLNPAVLTPARSRAGLGSSLFARRYSGNRFFFLFLRLLRCFSSPGPPPCAILFTHGYMEPFHVGLPIQIPADQQAFAPPRGFSQLIASFFGSQCQGIRPALFVA